MEIVLIQLFNRQEYVYDNIRNLLNHGNVNLTLITDSELINKDKKMNINIINSEQFIFNYSEIKKSIKETFRNGFWKLTSLRFNVLSSYMQKFNKKNIVHLENDVLLYCNINTINFHDKTKLLLTMDSKNRCIPGIMFIPNHNILDKCLSFFDKKMNDMQNFSRCYYKFNSEIDTLPIFNFCDKDEVHKMVTRNFKKYNAIFDAAAIGQYIGGVDPSNIKTNSVGFVNETCIIKYNNNEFIWKEINNLKVPYIKIDDKLFPILNLHIHCKNLKQFLS